MDTEEMPALADRYEETGYCGKLIDALREEVGKNIAMQGKLNRIYALTDPCGCESCAKILDVINEGTK